MTVTDEIKKSILETFPTLVRSLDRLIASVAKSSSQEILDLENDVKILSTIPSLYRQMNELQEQKNSILTDIAEFEYRTGFDYPESGKLSDELKEVDSKHTAIQVAIRSIEQTYCKDAK